MLATESSLSYAENRVQLQLILDSPRFRKSQRLSALLTFLFEETLAGRAHSLIQYRVATEGLGMKEDFDPDRQSLVRAHAARLRKELAGYYERPGHGDPIRFSMDSPGYGLVFSKNTRAAPVLGNAPSVGAPILAVSEFRGIGLTHDYRSLPALLSEELIAQNSRAEGLRVIGPFTRRELTGADCDFSLSGSIELRDGKLLIRARLLDGKTHVQIWSHRGEYPTEKWNINAFESLVPARIAAEISGHFGKMDRHLIRVSQGRSTHACSAQDAILKAKAFELDYSEESYQEGISALRGALGTDPENVVLREALGTLLIVAHSEYFSRHEPFPREARAHLAACRRIHPESSLHRHAFAYSYVLTGEFQKFADASEEILEDPGYPPLLAGLAILCRIYTKTVTQRDRQRLGTIMGQHSGYPKIFHSGMALEYLADGNTEAASREMAHFSVVDYWFGPVMQVAIHTAAGRLAEAREERAKLIRICPDFDQYGRSVLSRSLHPDYVHLLMAAQKEASV